MRHDSVGIKALRRLHDKQTPDQVLCHLANVIPVRRGKLKSALFDQLEQSLVVLIVEGRETTEPIGQEKAKRGQYLFQKTCIRAEIDYIGSSQLMKAISSYPSS